MQLDEQALSTLGKLGLTLYGAKAYYVLAAMGPLTATKIAAETGIPRTKIYEALSRLSRDGWVRVERVRPAMFFAGHPRDLIERYRSSLNEEIDGVGEELSQMYERQADREMPRVVLIRGMGSITAKTMDMVSRAKQSIILLGSLYTSEEIDELKELLVVSRKRGVTIRAIMGRDIRLRDGTINLADAFSAAIPEIRAGSPPSFRYVIIDGRELLNAFTSIRDGVPDLDSAIAMWVPHPTIASHTASMFNMIWETAGQADGGSQGIRP